MKHIFVTLLIVLSFQAIFAQPGNYLMDDNDHARAKAYKNSISLHTDFFFASNALTNELAKTYFLNGFITDAMKDGVSSNLGKKNRLGGEINIELYYCHRPDTFLGRTDLSWFAGLKNINHLNASFTRDLFEVYFRGNKNYAGRTADFSGFNYLLLKYQQLQFGITKYVTKDSVSFEMGAALGLNAGQQLLRIQSPTADLFTDDIGEFLDVNANIEIHRSDSSQKNFGSFNGFGASTDLFFSAEIKKKHYFSARISNLGFIRWNDRSSEVRQDSSFRFEGIDVSNVLNFSDTIKNEFSTDSLKNFPFLTHRKYNAYTLLLPAKIEVSYKRAITPDTRLGAGANYLLNADYNVCIYIDGDYILRKNIFSLVISYGGYTTFGTGIFYKHYFSNGYILSFGSDYINSLFSLDKSTSQSVHFSLRRNF